MIDKEFLVIHTKEFLLGSDNYLVDVTVNPGNVISIEIDNDNGVNIDDCVQLSRYLESKLNRDEEDFELTVGSVGLTEPFKSLRQYQKYIDKEVEVLTKKGQKLSGVLKSASNDEFVVALSKKVKLEGAKRKTVVSEDLHFNYDEIKYTKYLIRFK
ncbi:MAG: ribosome assembly cofactor RimP [Dysgonamonadaceae bacterium]|nr:ribosome assembly cofactor RimP [Dysgonamonadaceae bacterium]MDD4606558.1 ribosome assembly cofactor RimP [Dysgonamonadaceae bacterium]HUI32202.1 ribosome assembly cofactor RimP [Dysgonamonadaceae bacterium]